MINILREKNDVREFGVFIFVVDDMLMIILFFLFLFVFMCFSVNSVFCVVFFCNKYKYKLRLS